MKIVVAADSFKGNMRSDEVGGIIAAGMGEALPGAEIVVIPAADGGEGTTDAVVRATGGELKPVPVTGPLGGRRVICPVDPPPPPLPCAPAAPAAPAPVRTG